MTTAETKLRRALIRLLRCSVADDATCACATRDVCPQCQAMRALGAGRWRGPEHARHKLTALSTAMARAAKRRSEGAP